MTPHEKEQHDLCFSLYISKEIKSRKIRWAGLVACMSEKRHIVTVGKLQDEYTWNTQAWPDIIMDIEGLGLDLSLSGQGQATWL